MLWWFSTLRNFPGEKNPVNTISASSDSRELTKSNLGMLFQLHQYQVLETRGAAFIETPV